MCRFNKSRKKVTKKKTANNLLNIYQPPASLTNTRFLSIVLEFCYDYLSSLTSSELKLNNKKIMNMISRVFKSSQHNCSMSSDQKYCSRIDINVRSF